jgi:hypothetical protein
MPYLRTLVATICLLACWVGVGADYLLSVQAWPPVGPEPGLVRLLIRVDRAAGNRRLVVELNSTAMFRSSLITMEGESAPTIYHMEFDELPAGSYSVGVTLHREDGTTSSAADTFTVIP